MSFGKADPRRLGAALPGLATCVALTCVGTFGATTVGLMASAPAAWAQEDGAVSEDQSAVDAEAAADEIMGEEVSDGEEGSTDIGGEVPVVLPEAKAPEIGLKDVEYAVHSDLAQYQLLLDVAKAGDRLVSVGEFGHIVYSDDAGKTWKQAESVPTQVTLTSVQFPTDKVGYASGHDSKVLKTEDGGNTWELVYAKSNSQGPILSVYFLDENHGFAMGAFSLFLETEDGGKTWRNREMPVGEDEFVQFHLNKIFRSEKSGALFVSAEAGNVYRSKDDGLNWEMLATPYDGSFWGGTVLDSGRVIIVGMRGHAFYSDDEGDNWTEIETDTDKSIGGIAELSDGTIVLTGLQGYVGYSGDEGATFTGISRRDRLGFAAVTEAADGDIAIFGEPGVKLMPADVKAAEKEADQLPTVPGAPS